MALTTNFPDFTGKTIDRGRLLLQSQVGFGGAGVVYKAVEICGAWRRTFAVKWLGLPAHLRNGKASDKAEYQTRLANEVRLHGLVSDHPNVLTLHRVVEDRARECWWMVLDWCPGGDMFNALTTCNWWWRDEEKTKSVLLQLADAVAYCHARGVYHRDIKPENILINEDGSEVYLGDFGIATTAPYSNQWQVGTTAYQSPEVLDESFLTLRGCDAYSCVQADAWALGITLFNVLCAVNLWPAARTSELTFDMHTRFAHLNYVYHTFPISRPAAFLLRDVLTIEPMDRLSLNGFREQVEKMDAFYLSSATLTLAKEGMQEYIRYNDYYAEVARKLARMRALEALAAAASPLPVPPPSPEITVVPRSRPSTLISTGPSKRSSVRQSIRQSVRASVRHSVRSSLIITMQPGPIAPLAVPSKQRPSTDTASLPPTPSSVVSVAFPMLAPRTGSTGSSASASSADSSAPVTPQNRPALHPAGAVNPGMNDADVPQLVLDAAICEGGRGRGDSIVSGSSSERRKNFLKRAVKKVRGGWRRASMVLMGEGVVSAS